MQEDKEKLLKEVLDELDEMLEAHERYKEEYAKRRENLTSEEIFQLDLQELRASQEFAEKSGMKIEYINLDDKN